MTRLITSLDVREINHALLLLQKEMLAGTQAQPAKETPRSGGGVAIVGGGETRARTVPRTLLLVATREDGGVEVDGEGYAVMEEVAVRELV